MARVSTTLISVADLDKGNFIELCLIKYSAPLQFQFENVTILATRCCRDEARMGSEELVASGVAMVDLD